MELPSNGSHVGGFGGPPRRQRVNSGGSDVYYEDVDPRFAPDPEPVPSMPPSSGAPTTHAPVPALLTAPGQQQPYPPEAVNDIPPTHSYEDLPGARSPAESETSNFTSVSQRGVNPNWRPGNGGEFSSLGPARRRDLQMKRDMLLAGNPDFELPGMTAPGRTRTRGGGGSGIRAGVLGGGVGPARIPPASAAGAGADGRYPMGPPPPGSPGSGGMGLREI